MTEPELLSGKYEKHEVIGNGSYATIYSATDHSTGKQVALKRFKERIVSPDTYQSIIDEVSIHKELNSPRILSILDSFETPTKDVFIVTEIMDSDLSTVLRASKEPLSLAVRKSYLKQILEAVDYLHTHDILHRVCKKRSTCSLLI